MKISIPKEAVEAIMQDYNCSEEEAAKAYLDAQEQSNQAISSFLESRFDGFVKSQIGSLRCPLSGVSTPVAKFQELVASSSNSLEFLTPLGSKPFFRKVAMSLPNPTFYETVKFGLQKKSDDNIVPN
jgi:hypothetical protein